MFRPKAVALVRNSKKADIQFSGLFETSLCKNVNAKHLFQVMVWEARPYMCIGVRVQAERALNRTELQYMCMSLRNAAAAAMAINGISNVLTTHRPLLSPPFLSPYPALGASINDVLIIFGIFDPFPLCPHLELIYNTKFTQPPLLRPL